MLSRCHGEAAVSSIIGELGTTETAPERILSDIEFNHQTRRDHSLATDEVNRNRIHSPGEDVADHLHRSFSPSSAVTFTEISLLRP